ncbi:MAG: hypothetical protein KAU50_09470 [Candidatus Marinimicrobia bacterium]|nr:hypothetical protein [Candidatus Neomarinimicrobiota bacterium]
MDTISVLIDSSLILQNSKNTSNIFYDLLLVHWQTAAVFCIFIFALIFIGVFYNPISHKISQIKSVHSKGVTFDESEVNNHIDKTSGGTQIIHDDSTLESSEVAHISDSGTDVPDFDRYISDLSKSLDNRDLESAKLSFANIEALNHQNFYKVESYYNYIRFMCGDEKGLVLLKNMAQKKKYKYIANYHLGYLFRSIKEYNKSAEYFLIAAKYSDSPEQKASNTSDAAELLLKSGAKNRATGSLIELINQETDPLALSQCYLSLSKIYEKVGNTHLRIISLMKSIEYKPNDTNTLFKCAYALSENNYHALSTYYYQQHIKFDPSESACYNNLAVEHESNDLTIHAVNEYNLAKGKKNTLAMANLAQNYINAGFKDDAIRLIKEAQKLDDVHPKIGNVKNTIKNLEESENEKLEDVEIEALKQQKFMLAFCDSCFVESDTSIDFSGTWKTSDNQLLKFDQTDNRIACEGDVSNNKFRLKGLFRNRAIIAYYKKEEIKYPFFGDDTKEFVDDGIGLLYLDEDNQDILKILRFKDNHISISQLSKQNI